MDLSTRYLGLALRNPLVASASPLSNTLDGVRRLADAGVGAVVLFSLFEEQLRREAERNARLADAGADSFAESLSYFPAGADEDTGPRRYLSLLERAAAAVDIPVIGSLNGVTRSGWTSYARAMQDAGAAAIELNIYYIAGDPRMTGREVEQRHVDILCQVKDAVTRAGGGQARPAVQLSRRDRAAAGRGRRGRPGALQPVPAARHRPGDPRRAARRGPVQPGRGQAAAHLDLPAAQAGPRLARGDQRRRGTGRRGQVPAGRGRRRDDRVRADPARPQHAAVLLDGLSEWMARKGYASVSELRGLLAVPAGTDQAAYERAGYVRALRGANGAPW